MNLDKLKESEWCRKFAIVEGFFTKEGSMIERFLEGKSAWVTGGASGTRTLPINVYQQGFAISDIGMGSAVSMVIVVLLLNKFSRH